MRTVRSAGCVLALATLARGAHAASCPAAEASAHWVGTWASSPQLADAAQQPPAPGFADTTLRQRVHVSLGGRCVRVRFSNAFGATPLLLASAHIGLAEGLAGIRPGSDA